MDVKNREVQKNREKKQKKIILIYFKKKEPGKIGN
jgi:hypothetical protein